MNLIRSLMTLVMLIVFGISVAGWLWSSDLPSPKLEGARVALGLCAAMAVGTVALLWKEKPTSPDAEE